MKTLIITLISLSMVSTLVAQKTFKQSMLIMGCNFDITVIAKDQKKADQYITQAVEEMSRVERLISSWDPKSQTSEINRNAGIKPVHVDFELFELIHRAKKLSEITDGAFDISYASMDKVWIFDGSMTTMPKRSEIEHSVSLVGHDKVHLNSIDTSVYLEEKGMKIGFGAIGKGYAADKAKTLLKNIGVQGGIINASGDMNTWGKQINGQDWQIAITNPVNKSESYGLLPLKSGAVVTSGNYENFALIDGQRYAHIIDPRTGMPTKGILSTTIFSPSAELADAMATSVFVMGIDAGLDRINQLPNLECIIIDDEGRVHYSNNIKIDTK